MKRNLSVALVVISLVLWASAFSCASDGNNAVESYSGETKTGEMSRLLDLGLYVNNQATTNTGELLKDEQGWDRYPTGFSGDKEIGRTALGYLDPNAKEVKDAATVHNLLKNGFYFKVKVMPNGVKMLKPYPKLIQLEQGNWAQLNEADCSGGTIKTGLRVTNAAGQTSSVKFCEIAESGKNPGTIIFAPVALSAADGTAATTLKINITYEKLAGSEYSDSSTISNLVSLTAPPLNTPPPPTPAPPIAEIVTTIPDPPPPAPVAVEPATPETTFSVVGTSAGGRDSGEGSCTLTGKIKEGSKSVGTLATAAFGSQTINYTDDTISDLKFSSGCIFNEVFNGFPCSENTSECLGDYVEADLTTATVDATKSYSVKTMTLDSSVIKFTAFWDQERTLDKNNWVLLNTDLTHPSYLHNDILDAGNSPIPASFVVGQITHDRQDSGKSVYGISINLGKAADGKYVGKIYAINYSLSLFNTSVISSEWDMTQSN